MSKKSRPTATLDFGDSFGESPSKQIPQDYYDDYHEGDMKKEIPPMSHTLERLNRTDIIKDALANAQPKPSRATHVKLLSEHEWKLIHEARKSESKAGLKELFTSMQRSYQDNDEAFFKDYPQFYNAYRQAVALFGLPPIRVRKPKDQGTPGVS